MSRSWEDKGPSGEAGRALALPTPDSGGRYLTLYKSL